MDVGTTVRHTWDTCVSAGSMILDSLKGLFTRGEGLDQMAGPVGVINVIAQETRTYKLMGYLNMLMMISINLGLVNLLPIPGLDGCRILFVLFEMIFRRPVNRTVEAYIHLAGYVFLIGLMIFFTFKDVLNIFG
jgi:regulator of sigma E protease